jgi:signal transduction histidine kinase
VKSIIEGRLLFWRFYGHHVIEGLVQMENRLILNKLIILAYYILVYAGTEMRNTTAVVLGILIYVCLNTGLYIVKSALLKKGFLLVSIFLIIYCFLEINPLFILLLPINSFELISMYTVGGWLPLLMVATPLLRMDKEDLSIYLLVSSFSYIVYRMGHNSMDRIQGLNEANDALREKVYLLTGQFNNGLDFERQLNYLSQLEERHSIAQEIHDRVGHAIAGSLIQLEAAGLLVDRDQSKTRDIIQNVITVLREGMENIRATLRNIKPATEQLGINRVKLLLDEFTVNNQLKTSLVYSGNLDRIAPIQWKVILDNLGEALTNALKYSGATTISLKIEVLNKFVKAEVSDNGHGAYIVKKGLGISGMEERSGRISGKVVIDGSKGFSVITLLPMEEEQYGD